MRRPSLTVVGLVLVAATVVVLAGAVLRPLWQARAARSWTPIPCEITYKSVVETEDPTGRTSREALLLYRYTVGGRSYLGRRHDFRPFRGDTVDAREARHLYDGAKALCRVDPDDPTLAVLVPRGWSGLPASIILACAIAAIALVALGVGDRPAWRRRTRRSDGGVRIRARGHHPALVGALAAVAAVAVPSAALALGEDHGLLGVGFAVLVLLVVVKLVQIGAAFLTGVDLELAREPLRPGESVGLRWNVRRAREVRARLIARDETEYLVDDSRDYHEAVVVDRPLHLLIDLPADAMPTLTVGPCRRRWAIAIAAEIRGRPDLAVEVELDVAPGPAGEPLRGVVPVEPLAGAEHAELQLRWRSISSHGERETVVARHEVELPRDEGGSPYRAAAPPAYSFPDPVHPPAYQGPLFRIEWRLVLVVDGREVHAIDLPVRMAT